MTSANNHVETQKFLEFNHYFGATKDSIVLMEQRVFPLLSSDGKILMEEPNKIILHPNGSGSLIDCINAYQNVRNIINSVDYVQIINVDNPLTKVMDPTMIGFTAKNDLYLGLKAGERRLKFHSEQILAKKNKRYYVLDSNAVSRASDGEE